MSTLNVHGVFIGGLATVTMDLLSTIVYKLRLIAPLPRCFIGRWVASVARGQMFVRDIGQLAPGNHEVTIALSVHYVIGITLALIYLLMSWILGLSPRNLSLALGFGLCTNVFPWFLMFPAMGYGWFGSHGPEGTRLFLSSLVSHCFYGVGLLLGASILS
jgi:hypothetical protein